MDAAQERTLSGWPALDYGAERPTIETCHLILQLLGKLPTRLHPWTNHGWHVAVRMTPHGYVTRTMPGGEDRAFTAELDLCGECIRIACEDGGSWTTAVAGKTIAQLHADLTAVLQQAGLPAPLHGGPNELAEAIPFAEDERPREWNGDAARRLHRAFLLADRVLNRFRSLYLGKSSPSHLFWGSFDLAVTRFSGREAPLHPGGIPNLPDTVTREAYSHEVISAGMWPGGGGVEEAAFYAYAYPTPKGLSETRVAPESAYWHSQLREFVLPYAAVAGSPDPDAMLIEFLQSTYYAAAGLLDWPQGLTLAAPRYGRPAQEMRPA